MEKQEFNERTGSDVTINEFTIVNSVQALRTALRIKWLPDIVSLYQKGGIELLKSIDEKLLAIRENRGKMADLSLEVNMALRELKGSIR